MTIDCKKLAIRDIFDQERDPLRTLNTIIQVKDDSPVSLWTEFEEFVLTESLLQYLKEFHNDFTASLEFEGPKKPFWLEGFYGSGKSHFSKMIGYLFQNAPLKDLNGKEWGAIDFFVDQILHETEVQSKKAQQWKAELLEALPLYSQQFRCKSLFIDLSDYSKSETATANFMESFTIALLKEFNKSLGLAESIELAEVEKNMIREGIYDQYKEQVLATQDETWEEVRKSGPWARRTFINIYAAITNHDKMDAEAYIAGAKSECEQKTAENVLQEINEWVEANLSHPEQGIQGKCLIILDEAGLFFSAKASRIGEMMSVSQWIQNRVKKSHINMIFNAQQSIKTYFESVKTDVDYRTAEQRFTHWFLDKKNIKTVVVKRWLKKDEHTGSKCLQPFIENEYPKIIDGSLLDTIKDPNLEFIRPRRSEIYETYPFLPYQFPLMIQITQSLITEKIVEEQFGGKTRSILSMTRDVLNNSLRFSDHPHFVDESLGTFVTLPQIYDCITYTLKNKEEDQFILVDRTLDLPEDPKEFTTEERALPFSFYEVMKIILLLKHVEEIYSSDQNIAKSLFNSIDCDQAIILQKVKKLIDILKKKGNISYHKRQVETTDGDTQEIWEYKIASQEEKEWIEKTHRVHTTDQDVARRFRKFFQDGEGKNLIDFRDAQFVNTLLDMVGNDYSISNPVKLKCNWQIDPAWDSVENTFHALELQINELSHDSFLIVVISPKTLQDHQKDLPRLKRKIQTIAAKAIRKQKLVAFICPSFSITVDEILTQAKFLDSSLRECEKIEQTTIKDQNIPGNIKQSFYRRVEEIERDILGMLEDLFNEGAIYFGKKEHLRISKDSINGKLMKIVQDLFSQINHKAYLGQVKPSSTEIQKILQWDPKKKSSIPPIFKKSEKSATEAIFLFNSDGTELKPSYAEQITSLTQEFKLLNQQHLERETVSGGELKEIFENPPYNWTIQTLLACVAGLLRDHQWDVLKGETIFNYNDKDILTAFKSQKNDYGQFQSLYFKVAENLTQEQMSTANSILRDLFNQAISRVGPDGLKTKIGEIAQEITSHIQEIEGDLNALHLSSDLVDNLATLKNKMNEVSETPRSIDRIKLWLSYFKPYLSDPDLLEDFRGTKRILYRIEELHNQDQVNRYIWLEEFLQQTMKDWLASNRSNPEVDYESLSQSLTNIRSKLRDPTYLFEENWKSLWVETHELWSLYWNEYWKLHESLQPLISEKMNSLQTHSQFGSLTDTQKNSLQSAFMCEADKHIPDTIQTNQFTCSECQNTYNRLEVIKLKEIEKRYENLVDQLDKMSSSTKLGKTTTTGQLSPKVFSQETTEMSIKQKREFIFSTIQQGDKHTINKMYAYLKHLLNNDTKN